MQHAFIFSYLQASHKCRVLWGANKISWENHRKGILSLVPRHLYFRCWLQGCWRGAPARQLVQNSSNGLTAGHCWVRQPRACKKRKNVGQAEEEKKKKKRISTLLEYQDQRRRSCSVVEHSPCRSHGVDIHNADCGGPYARAKRYSWRTCSYWRAETTAQVNRRTEQHRGTAAQWWQPVPTHSIWECKRVKLHLGKDRKVFNVCIIFLSHWLNLF